MYGTSRKIDKFGPLTKTLDGGLQCPLGDVYQFLTQRSQFRQRASKLNDCSECLQMLVGIRPRNMRRQLLVDVDWKTYALASRKVPRLIGRQMTYLDMQILHTLRF